MLDGYPIERLANEVLRNPERFDAQQRHWASTFLAASESKAIGDEVALLEASYPARFLREDWYSYFLNRCNVALHRFDLSEVGSSELSNLMKLRARFAAFSGQLMGGGKATYHRPLAQGALSLTIGVDIRPLSIPSSRKRGIGRYLTNTLSRLIALGNRHKFVMLSDDSISLDNELLTMFTSGVTEFRSFGPDCDRDLDVFLLTDPLPMLAGRRLAELPIRNCPWVSIIYDFIPLEFPNLYLRDSRLLTDEYLENFEFVAQNCDRLFPISSYVAKQCEYLLQAASDHIVPIFGGVDDSFFVESDTHVDRNEPYFLYVGGADARKNIPGLLKSFAIAVQKLPRDCKLMLVGEMTADKTAQMLEATGLEYLSHRIIGRGGLDDEQLMELYRNATATVFVSFCEGLGLPALEAMACGCPVLASNTTALGETVGEYGVLVDPTSPTNVAEGMVALATNSELRSRLRVVGPDYARRWQWEKVASTLLGGIELSSRRCEAKSRPSRRLRIAMMNRPDVWSAPGGDSRIMQQMQAAAANRDIEIYFPNSPEDAVSCDVVHIVNLTLPGPLNRAANIASKLRKPLVLTTLYEDWPMYLNASHQAFSLFVALLQGRVRSTDLPSLLKKIQVPQSAPKLDVTSTVSIAAALLACGDSEAKRLAADFPTAAQNIHVLPFEVTPPLPAEQKTIDSLKNALGFNEFVLCIGRLETRKNQLALLAALQDVDIPIVFAAGDYSPQKSYDQAVRSWRRKAPVKFVDRVPWYLMSALIRSASVHALPSFYELPGLVHLECAAAGTPIVAPTWGALGDYIPLALFNECDPLDLGSLRTAVESALNQRPSPALAEIASSYTQDMLADNLAALYGSAVGSSSILNSQNLCSQNRRTSPKATGGIHVAV